MLPEICGYATRFNTITSQTFNEALGWHRFMVRPRAFAKVIREQQSPVVACIKHHEDLHVATTANGTLLLSEDEYGLFVRIIPCGEIGSRLVEALKSERLNEMSIHILPAKNSPTFLHNGETVEDVSEVDELIDVCFTDRGAMPGTRAMFVE